MIRAGIEALVPLSAWICRGRRRFGELGATGLRGRLRPLRGDARVLHRAMRASGALGSAACPGGLVVSCWWRSGRSARQGTPVRRSSSAGSTPSGEGPVVRGSDARDREHRPDRDPRRDDRAEGARAKPTRIDPYRARMVGAGEPTTEEGGSRNDHAHEGAGKPGDALGGAVRLRPGGEGRRHHLPVRSGQP